MVWVFGYHLMLLPSLLRHMHPRAAIGYFQQVRIAMHWVRVWRLPHQTAVRRLPFRRASCFDSCRAAKPSSMVCWLAMWWASTSSTTPRTFVAAAPSCWGSSPRLLVSSKLPYVGVLCPWYHLTADGLVRRYRGSTTGLCVCPMGISPHDYVKAVETDEVAKLVAGLRETYEGMTMILGVDKLDDANGLVMKLQTFDRLLKLRPALRNKVVLVQVTSQPAGVTGPRARMVAGLQSRIHAMIGRLNGKYSRVARRPPAVHMHTAKLSFNDMCALYAVADIVLVTPVCAGMNPVRRARGTWRRWWPLIELLAPVCRFPWSMWRAETLCASQRASSCRSSRHPHPSCRDHDS